MFEPLSQKEIQKLLESLGVERYDFIDEKEYAQLIKPLSGLPKDTMIKILSGAFFYSEISKKNINAVTINNIFDVIAKNDLSTLEQLYYALSELEKSGMDDQNIKVVSKQIFNYVTTNIDTENKNLVNISSQFVVSANKVSSTFSNLSRSLRSELINSIYHNCLSRMKTFWQRVDSNNFIEIIETLTKDLNEDNFNEKEIIDLSNKCATIFCESSRQKILGLEEVLLEFKDYCLIAVENSAELKSEDIAKLKNFRIGQILRTSSSIAKANTRTLHHTSEFLQGKSVSKIFEHKILQEDKNAELYKQYGDVKLDLSVNDMVWALTKNPSLFTTSLTNTLEFLDKIKSSIVKSYGNKANDINFSCLITRDNFLKGIPTNVEETNIAGNIELLSCFMTHKELEAYLQSDMSIFSIDNQSLHDLVLDVFINNKNAGDIYKNLNDVLKCKIHEHLKNNITDNKKGKQKQENKNLDIDKIDYQVPNVKLNIEELKDFVFDFDLKKLKTLLGKHYTSFVETLKNSGVNSSKLNEIISENKEQNVVKSIEDSRIKIDASKLQQSAHSGYSKNVNKIEALWQLQRNISSAIDLINKFQCKGELDDEKFYIITSNYFKLAGEKDGIFSNLNMIEDHYKGTASYLSDKVEKHFQELTQKYSDVIKDNYAYLEGYISKLKNQLQILQKQMERFKFEDLDESVELDLLDKRKHLVEKLKLRQSSYEDNQERFNEVRCQVRNLKGKIEQERQSPTEKVKESKSIENINLFTLIYVSKREEELQIELEKLLMNQSNIECQSNKIISEIDNLQDQLQVLDDRLKGNAVTLGLSQRLAEIKARLHYALNVRTILNGEQEEK